VFQYLLSFNNGDKSICYSVFQGVDLYDSQKNLIWILGDYFLTRFYSIYDLKLNRIGLAKSISYNYLPKFSKSLSENSGNQTGLFSSSLLILFLLFLII
jgi:hypothetical protein